MLPGLAEQLVLMAENTIDEILHSENIEVRMLAVFGSLLEFLLFVCNFVCLAVRFVSLFVCFFALFPFPACRFEEETE